MASTGKKWKGSLIRITGGIIIVLVVAEVLLRVLQVPALQFFWNQKALHAYHPVYNVALEPNVRVYLKHNLGLWEGEFSTNSLGHRGSPEPDPSGKNLVCLGDSIVMGFGVSDGDTFCHRLDGLQVNGETLRAINLGVDAFGSRGVSERLLEASGQFDFRFALFILSPNDFVVPDEMAARGALPDDVLDEMRLEDPDYRKKFKLQFQLTKMSYLLLASRLAFEQLKIKMALTETDVKSEVDSMGLLEGSPAKMGEYIKGSFYRGGEDCDSPQKVAASTGSICSNAILPDDCEDQVPDPTDLEELPPAARKAYDRMVEDSHKRGYTLYGVMLPQQTEVLRCGAGGRHHRYFNYALRAAAYLKKKGARVLDLRPALQGICAGEKPGLDPAKMLIPGDGHFTAEGNRWVSRALQTAIQKDRGEADAF